MDWRRSRPRIPVQYPVRLHSDDNMGGGMLTNLSPAGCQVRSTLPLEPGTYVAVDINVPNHAHPVGVELSIVRWEQNGRYGLEFVKYAQDARERLFKLLSGPDGQDDPPPAAALPTIRPLPQDQDAPSFLSAVGE